MHFVIDKYKIRVIYVAVKNYFTYIHNFSENERINCIVQNAQRGYEVLCSKHGSCNIFPSPEQYDERLPILLCN